jgi:hypothetical protein
MIAAAAVGSPTLQEITMNRNDHFTAIHVAATAALLATLGACGGGGGGGDGPPPPPVIAVSVSPAAFNIRIEESQQFTATVTGSSNTAVTWSVTGPGCVGAACGTVNNAGLYTAPAIVPVPPSVSVIATAQADTSKTASAALTIGSDVALTVWPANARVTVNNSRQFLRMLTGSTNAAVNWSVGGPGCAGADCGSVSSAGLYQAPAQMPTNVTTVSVTATSVVDPGKSAQAAVTLQPFNVRSLSGNYAILYRGVWADSEGHLAGTFAADGNGVITSGVLDRTNALIVGGQPAGNLNNVPYTGAYAIGDDNRGLLTMNFSFGTVTYSTAVPASGEAFFLQAFYDTGARGTAVVLKQDPNAFTPAAINGTYVFQWTGSDVNRIRMANIGRFTADGNGAITSGAIDSNDGTSGFIDTRTFTGSYTVASNSRGTMQIAVPGVGAFNFALYVVSGETLIVTSTDDLVAGSPMRIGFALRQSGGPFSAASLNGNYVFDLSGRNSASSAVATVGRLISDGAGNLSGTYDRNDNYTMTPATGQPVSATYTIDATGRGLMDAATMARLVYYMVNPNKALLMEAPGVNPARVQTGTLERQVAAPYSTANMIGQFASASSPPALLNSVTVTGQNFYGGLGTVPSALDIVSPCSMVSGAAASANWTVTSAGRIDVRDAVGVQHAAGYLISPARYVMVLERASGGPACDEVVHFYTAEQ